MLLSLLAACGGAVATRPAVVPVAVQAAEVTDAGALGLCLPETKTPAPCMEECNRGIAAACAELADRFETAREVPRDLTRAATLRERACELRDPQSCTAAARMHGTGRGVVPNRARQVELLVAACHLGDGAACATAARAYETGAGVSADEARAGALRERACLAGDAESCGDD